MAALAVVLAAFAIGSASAVTPATIGQTIPSGTVLCGDYWLFQTDAGYVVPAGDWEVTSWSTQAGTPGGSMGLMIFRATGSGTYTVVGASPVEALTPGTLNTFTLASPIAVQPGDYLGMVESGAYCGSRDTGSVIGGGPAAPAVGDTVTKQWGNSSFLANISATLTSLAPALPTTKDECRSGGWKSFGDRFKNQGDCVSYVATGGKNQPAG